MKILYVEDELSKNIPRILRLFEKYLSHSQKERLIALENDESGYGASPEEIKEVVEEEGIIEVEFSFPSALKKVLNNSQSYALYIIDRNLSAFPYKLEDVKSIDKNFNEKKYQKFIEREGDYFLNLLIYENSQEIQDILFFLTAYPPEDELRGLNDIKVHFENEKFSKENFIEKGDEKAFNRLVYFINNHEILLLRKKNGFYLQALSYLLNDEAEYNFFNIIREINNQSKLYQNIRELRIIFENLLKLTTNYFDFTISNANGNSVYEYIHRLYESQKSNKLIRSILLNIWTICSEYGAHRDFSKQESFFPTVDTANSLLYQLKDTIRWVYQLDQEVRM